MTADLGYTRCTSLAEALELRSRLSDSCLVLAGGTDLIINMRTMAASDRAICDISDATELDFIGRRSSSIEIGPLTTHATLETSDLILEHARIISLAAGSVGSPQIRAMGTVGGNICNASPCADVVPALVACDAVLTLSSATGDRDIALSSFLEAPYRTGLGPDEILSKITIPVPPPGSHMGFLKLGRRNACAISRMNFAVIVHVDHEGKMVTVRLAAGSVAPTAMRFEKVEDLLAGSEPSREIFEEAGRVMAGEMIAVSGRRWSTPYKEPVVAALTRRVLMEACGMSDE